MTKHCDHKFIDSKHCLKCGWVPPPRGKEPWRVIDGGEVTTKTPTLQEDLRNLASVTKCFSLLTPEEGAEIEASVQRIEQALADLPHLENGAGLYATYMRLSMQCGTKFPKDDMDWLKAEDARLARKGE